MSGGGPPPRPGGETDYQSYLLIDDLLDLQRPLSDGAEDEMLFIVVHQSYELWFKLVLHELEGARAALFAGAPWRAARRVGRAVAAEELLVRHLDVLETMSPDGFFAFRDPLAPASGFQSAQFREIETLSGGIGPSPGAVAARHGRGRDRLAERAAEPTLWDATVSALVAHEAVQEGADEAELVRAVARIYRHHDEPVLSWFHELFERLVDHDEVLARWRHDHMLMAAREIGARPGTGGSLGVAYLARTLDKRFFPVLWQVRSEL